MYVQMDFILFLAKNGTPLRAQLLKESNVILLIFCHPIRQHVCAF